MKILMLNYEYPPLGSGAANANKYVLRELSKKDVEIDLITSSPESESVEDIHENITVHRIDVNKKSDHEWRQREILRYATKGFIKYRELSSDKDYDLIHAWSGVPCGIMARLMNEPYIVALRGSDVPGYNPRFSFQYLFLKPAIKNVWKNAEKVIPNSQGLEKLAEETLDIRMEVIPNGVDTDQFKPGKNSDTGELNVLCVSRLIPRKRVTDLVEAVTDLENIHLTVVGDGKNREKLEEKAEKLGIEKKVSFKGQVPHEEIDTYYSEADVFVLPSLNEGMSNTLLEAISSGLPVITTPVGGTDELVDDNGVIVEKKSPESIEKALRSYQSEREKIQRHGKRSREIAEQMNWEKIAGRYIETYREVVNEDERQAEKVKNK